MRGADRVQTPIDAFLLAKPEARSLTFSPPADRRTLLRRVYFDLIGLPPTFEEIQAFEHDRSPDAYARIVDSLLGSPGYGERWGRHWLDVARYADTKDLVLLYGRDAVRPYAYTYRDYVIRAFNKDLPFDQFVRDQLAADLAEPKLPPWRLAALGLLTLGRLFDNNPHDQIDDQIDTVTRGFLGLTVACARCHDHKYDAITMKDYYGLYGVFASAERPYDLPLIEDPKKVPGGVEFEEKLAKARHELEQQIETEFVKLTENFRQRIGDYLVRAATTKPDITETTQFALSLIPEDFRPSLMQRMRRFIDERVKPNDRVFGPWAQLMSLPDEEFIAKADAAIDALKSRSGECAGCFNPLVVQALAQATLTNKAAVPQVYGRLLHEVYEESKKPVAGSAQGGPSPDERPPTERAFLRMFTGGEARPFTHGSGRWELAEAITTRTNPLTARVFVNRVWMHHFGEPLVTSTTDFGARSEPPENLPLLDWLASEFVRAGWSVKHLHRVILLSSAYLVLK